MRPRVAAAIGVACAAGLEARDAHAQAVQTTGHLAGMLIAREVAAPLSYGVVSAPGVAADRFTDERGTFLFRDLPAGPVRLRVRRIGYTPKEVVVTVRAGALDTVRIELSRVAVRLTAVRVTAKPLRCDRPGPPRADGDAALAAAFDQLQVNALQYRLLAHSYPFAYLMEEVAWIEERDGNLRLGRTDTLRIDSAAPWRYRPGALLSHDQRPGRQELRFNVPTLVDLADSAFTGNHCFRAAGMEEVHGEQLFRFDVTASARLRTPDVDGAIYLDPETFQVRRSVLRLTNAGRAVRGLATMEVTTIFREALPSIPIAASLESRQRFQRRYAPGGGVGTRTEQRLLSFRFLGAQPGDPPAEPTLARSRATTPR